MDPVFTITLIAAAPDWIKLVGVVVFIVIWIVNNLMGDKGKAGKARPPQVRPVPPPQNPNAPPAQEQPQPQLISEIDEFLKRAQQKRREKTQRKQQPKPVAKAAPPPAPKPVRRLVTTSTSEGQSFDAATGKGVADHVQNHLDTRQFTERAAHMTDDIMRGDAQREAHRKQVFDHKVGTLTDTSTSQTTLQAGEKEAARVATDAAAAANATPLASMLANPESLRQAIVLNEILKRPEHLW